MKRVNRSSVIPPQLTNQILNGRRGGSSRSPIESALADPSVSCNLIEGLTPQRRFMERTWPGVGFLRIRTRKDVGHRTGCGSCVPS